MLVVGQKPNGKSRFNSLVLDANSLKSRLHLFSAALVIISLASTTAIGETGRYQWLLSDTSWQFTGVGSNATLPEIGSDEFMSAPWQTVTVPHVFQTRAHFKEITQGWYRREVTVPPELSGKCFYLVFEGAATIADVYLNGKHLGQHRGAYTRFVLDATEYLHTGKNALTVRVDNDPKDYGDCLPSRNGLYTVWGGLYRKVWLVATDPLHIDPTDYGSPGIYITPKNISASKADLSIKILLRNASTQTQNAEVCATLLDPEGLALKTMTQKCVIASKQREAIELTGSLTNPRLWSPGVPNLYHVKVEVRRDGKVVDQLTQPTGFRNLAFEKATGRVMLNGKPIILAGADLHQEIESKASAMSDDDFRADYAFMQDLGFNFVRLSHYPRAQLEYDLCDRMGFFCWTENGHSNMENEDKPGPTADQITTEMVKQNYNHPSIAVWSVGNEAGEDVADREVPLVKALDAIRPVVVANMKCTNADFHGINAYPGWYGKTTNLWKFVKKGYVTETGAGGVTTIHCDYSTASAQYDKYEPEEYQQLIAEARFQACIHENSGTLGVFTWWCLRDFTDVKYKRPIGWNSKGLLTYAGDKKDIYYLYRCFLRPDEPTVHITSQRYFIRTGAVDNGIKAYSSAAQLTLTLNDRKVSTLENGQYTQKQSNGHHIANVFYWPVPLHTGKNTVTVSDDAGHSDSAVIYFYGTNGLPELPVSNPLLIGLRTSNPDNQAYFMDMPVQAQWPIYYDLDSTADNSFDKLPDAIQGAKWIALRRLTKPGQETDLTFKLTRPATIFVMATKQKQAPSFLTDTGFKEVSTPDLTWRDNRLMLVPSQLFSRQAAAGDVIHFAQPDRDEIVLLKE
jgi:beta-galactosidase